MRKCRICHKKIGIFDGYENRLKGYCSNCLNRKKHSETKEETKELSKKIKTLTKEEIKQYKEWTNGGFFEYVLTQGGKMGIIFAGLMFLMDYFIFQEGYGAGMYIFYFIFFGFFSGWLSWNKINKLIKEDGEKK